VLEAHSLTAEEVQRDADTIAGFLGVEGPTEKNASLREEIDALLACWRPVPPALAEEMGTSDRLFRL